MKNSEESYQQQQQGSLPSHIYYGDNGLVFHGIDLLPLIRKYGTPLRVTYLPDLKKKIAEANRWFNNAFQEYNYQGKYIYCYSTKPNHRSHIVKKMIDNGAHLETSSPLDIHLIWYFYNKGLIDKDVFLIHNGYKTRQHLEMIKELSEKGFKNSINVVDSYHELELLGDVEQKIGIRVTAGNSKAISKSRHGIPQDQLFEFYREKIATKPQLSLVMFHFFCDDGIRDSINYRKEFRRVLTLYTGLTKICPSLHALNIGGGLPIANKLNFTFDYKKVINDMVRDINTICKQEQIPEPDIISEFGTYSVGESGALFFRVLGMKDQGKNSLWYILNGSLFNTIPDNQITGEPFIVLPVNQGEKTARRVHLGGLSCDQIDQYTSSATDDTVLLPVISEVDPEPLYVGFLHTGAYQEAIGGYGGVQHCLVPQPTHIFIDEDDLIFNIIESNNIEQDLAILGYDE